MCNKPAKPLRKYYVHLEEGPDIPTERAQTTSRFRADGKTENVPVDDEFEWKLELSEYASDKLEWKKKMRD